MPHTTNSKANPLTSSPSSKPSGIPSNISTYPHFFLCYPSILAFTLQFLQIPISNFRMFHTSISPLSSFLLFWNFSRSWGFISSRVKVDVDLKGYSTVSLPLSLSLFCFVFYLIVLYWWGCDVYFRGKAPQSCQK